MVNNTMYKHQIENEDKKKLVIVGAGEFAEIAYEYFTYDSDYEVVGFAVEKAYIKEKELFGKPITALENILTVYPPEKYVLYTAVTYTQFNRVRKRLYEYCKNLGYSFATYISSKAFVWKNAEIGENTFIFENNIIQYHVKVGNNCVLWSGNHIGHRSVIRDNCWLTSQAVVSGFCEIGKNCFVGVNATIGDKVKIPDDTWVAAAACLVKSPSEEKGKIYVGVPAKPLPTSAYEKFNVKESEI